MVRPRFDAARCTRTSYTLAKPAAAPSDFAEYLIARLATGLDYADREPFRLAAESALATLPPQSLGDGAVYRTVEPIWRRYFIPPRAAPQRGTAARGSEAASSSKKASGAINPSSTTAPYPRANGERTACTESDYHEAAERLRSAIGLSGPATKDAQQRWACAHPAPRPADPVRTASESRSDPALVETLRAPNADLQAYVETLNRQLAVVDTRDSERLADLAFERTRTAQAIAAFEQVTGRSDGCNETMVARPDRLGLLLSP
jgi:hypothetical protein